MFWSAGGDFGQRQATAALQTALWKCIHTFRCLTVALFCFVLRSIVSFRVSVGWFSTAFLSKTSNRLFEFPCSRVAFRLKTTRSIFFLLKPTQRHYCISQNPSPISTFSQKGGRVEKRGGLSQEIAKTLRHKTSRTHQPTAHHRTP